MTVSPPAAKAPLKNGWTLFPHQIEAVEQIVRLRVSPCQLSWSCLLHSAQLLRHVCYALPSSRG